MKKIYLKRFFLISVVCATIFTAFYLYLPQREWIVYSMNETIGENKADVVFVGSSHVYSGINPLQMFEDKGIAGYDIAIGSQAPWQSYYYIKQIKKFQNPKLIVFDVYVLGTTQSESYYKDYQTVTNLLDAPTSIDKIQAVLDSKADSRLNILLRFPYLYDEIDENYSISFHKYRGESNRLMGYYFNNNVFPYEDVESVGSVKESKDLCEKNEKYLRMIIEYCRENDIDILLVNTPWPCITEEYQQYFNRIGEIASEYGVAFLDGCSKADEIGMDYLTDSYGDGGHLNYAGVTKYTKWVEEYISSHYSLTDRREDPEYEVYWSGLTELKNKTESSRE